MKLLLALLVTLTVAGGASAQSVPVLPTVPVRLTDGHTRWTQQLPVRRRTADRRFFLMAALSQAATVADVENSIHALSQPGVAEANPLFGPHPNRAAYYGVTEPIWAAMTLFSYRYKREDDALADAGIRGHRWSKWWVSQVMLTGAHGFGLAVTLGSTGR